MPPTIDLLTTTEDRKPGLSTRRSNPIMASWLQAQLKAAENLLEAVDRTVSATTGVAGAPPGPTNAGNPGGQHTP